MAFRRIDPMTAVDEFGNQFWLPDLGGGVGSDRDQSGGDPLFDRPDVPFWTPTGSGPPPESGHDIQLPPDSHLNAPNMFDPSARLMPPGETPPNRPDFHVGVDRIGSSDPGAVIMPQGAGPVDPYATPVSQGGAPPSLTSPLGPSPKSVGQADAQESAAFNDSTQANIRSGQAKADSERMAQERVADAYGQSVESWDKQNAANEKIYAAAAQKADQDTAAWLKDMQDASNAKVDPSRYWNDASTFSKVAWIISLAASSYASSRDPQKNVALKMLSDEIDQDRARQHDEILRKIDASKTKGGALTRQQDRDLQHARDVASGSWQRWDAVSKYAMSRAQIPGPEATKAALMQVAAEAENRKLTITGQRADRAHQEAQQAAGRAVQMAGQAQADRHFKTTTLIQAAQHEEDRADKYNLAQMGFDAKAGAAEAKAAADKDHRPLPQQSGFRVQHKDGTFSELVVPKEQYDKVSETARDTIDSTIALKNLRKSFSDATTSGKILNNDAAFQSALMAAVGPFIKNANGGRGGATEQDVSRGLQGLIGYDSQSLFAKLKGPDREEVLSLLDKQIAALPQDASKRITVASGTHIPEGDQLVFTPDNDTGWKDIQAPSPEGELAAGGVQLQGPPHPKTVAEYRSAAQKDAQLGQGAALPDLSKAAPEVDQVIGDLSRRAAVTTGEHVTEMTQAARRAIDAWSKANAGKPGAKDIAADAQVRVEAISQDAYKHSADLEDAVTRASVFQGADPASIRAATERAGFRLSGQELAEIVKQVETRLAKQRKALLGSD